VRLEGQFKNLITSPGIEPAKFRLVSQCLNQLRYRVIPFMAVETSIFFIINIYVSYVNQYLGLCCYYLYYSSWNALTIVVIIN
jgi:hypothetical protein